MEPWSEGCFKAYDIRGLAYGDGTGELTPAFAYRLGRAIATYLDCASFAVGRDIRESSPALASELMRGLSEGGVKVLDLGIVSTGCVYHACWTLPVDGGVMVTASHLSMPTHNGFKMCKGTLPLAGEEIQELKHVFLSGEFRVGEGEILAHPHMEAYLDAIVASTGPLSRPVKVAVDSGNAVPGPYICQLFDKMGVQHVDLYCEWDASEPNHGADPTRPKNMVDLAIAVVEHACEFGIGVDGDGDRIGAVDEQGRFIYPDRLIALLAEDLLKDEDELPQDAGDDEHLRIVYDVKCSMNVEQAILNAGGRPVMARTGHSFMKRVLASMPACKMAAEMSGHIFLADRGWYGFDCSLYNAARLIELWSRHAPASEGGPTFSSELDRLAPSLPTTGEVKVPCPEERKREVVTAITEAFADHECSVVDGVRVRFHNEEGAYVGWFLARQSNTEAVLIMRIEAEDEQQLARIRETVDKRVSATIDIEKLLCA